MSKMLAGQRKSDLTHINKKRDVNLDYVLDGIVVNMFMRGAKRGIDKKELADKWLHLLEFNQTFINLDDPDAKNYRIREQFGPILDICDGDENLLLAVYARKLDKYFPIKHKARAWDPQLKWVEYTPKRRGSKTVLKLTIVHKWKNVKKSDVQE